MAVRKFTRNKGTKRKSRGAGAKATAPGAPFGQKHTPPRPKPASSGASASSPGHLKKAAGVKSARSFAPGHTKRGSGGLPSAARPVPGTPPSAGPSTPQRPSRPVPPTAGGGIPDRGSHPRRPAIGGAGANAMARGAGPRSYPGGAGTSASAPSKPRSARGSGATYSLQPTGTPKPYGQKGRPRRRTA